MHATHWRYGVALLRMREMMTPSGATRVDAPLDRCCSASGISVGVKNDAQQAVFRHVRYHETRADAMVAMKVMAGDIVGTDR